MAVTILSAAVQADNRKRIGFYYPDINVEETVNFKNNITQHPIETGENIADHFYQEPVKLEIQGYTGDDAYTIGTDDTGPTVETGRALIAYETLKELKDERQPFTVITGYDTYNNMLISELNLPRTMQNGSSLFFNCKLEQVRFVDTQISRIGSPRKAARGVRRKVAAKAKVGKTQPTATTAKQSQTIGGKAVVASSSIYGLQTSAALQKAIQGAL